MPGRPRLDVHDEFQAFFRRPQRHRIDRTVNDGANIELDRFEVEAARLDLGDIENVIDQSKQGTSARKRDFGILPLIGRQ
ncbi:MAG: hypothetical protein ABSF86_17685 [Steroidobacteraceae bacterium]